MGRTSIRKTEKKKEKKLFRLNFVLRNRSLNFKNDSTAPGKRMGNMTGRSQSRFSALRQQIICIYIYINH